MQIGLRIDVDTYRGTQYGVPNLCKLLAKHSIKASFFFSVGPDNMGRHLWRLARPDFFWKMLRTRAAKLYGWNILLRGTFWPGPVIGKKLNNVICATADAGHEVGLHAWDHYAWQKQIDSMDARAIHQSIEKGFESLTRILGYPPVCSAVPGWKCNGQTLLAKERFPFKYNSDCRGGSIFYPIVDNNALLQPQIPVTLPTYDEVIGHNDLGEDNYNTYLLSLLDTRKLNVLTIHAEVEGIVCLSLFESFIELVQSKGWDIVPLGELLNDVSEPAKTSIVQQAIPGRAGRVACQKPVSGEND